MEVDKHFTEEKKMVSSAYTMSLQQIKLQTFSPRARPRSALMISSTSCL
jgi:hypothetical protein